MEWGWIIFLVLWGIQAVITLIIQTLWLGHKPSLFQEGPKPLSLGKFLTLLLAPVVGPIWLLIHATWVVDEAKRKEAEAEELETKKKYMTPKPDVRTRYSYTKEGDVVEDPNGELTRTVMPSGYCAYDRTEQ
jgi:hypothetical protein